MKVAEHVVDAFRAFLEVRFNGILYAREEKFLTKNAIENLRVELYFRGMGRFNGKSMHGWRTKTIARATRRAR